MLLMSIFVEDVLNELRFFQRSGYFLWCLYVISNHGLRKINFFDKLWSSTPTKKFLLITIAWILALILFAISMTLLIPFTFIKIVTVVSLRLIHKEKFGGMFQSADILWVVEDQTALNVINLLMLIKFDRKSKRDLRQFAKKLIEERIFTSTRMNSVRKFVMGYGYFLLDELKSEEIISTYQIKGFEESCDESELKYFIEEFSNRELPKENTASCELIILENNINLDDDDDDDGEQYAFLLRVHHSIADGITLMSMFNQNVSDGNKIKKKKCNKKEHFTVRDKMKEFYNSHAHLHTLLAKTDRNSLKSAKLSGNKKIAFKIERKGSDLFEKVKRIKKSIPDCVFSNVLLTAISRSLYDYFKENSKMVPKNLILTFMALADRNQLHFNHKKLRNIFSMGSIRLPIDLEEKQFNLDLIDRLKLIIDECKKLDDSSDVSVHYWQLKTFSNLIPRWIVKFIIKLNDVTSVSFSNLPGVQKMDVFGNRINHMLFWVPNFVTTGVGFSLLTYDDRFQMGLLVDETLINDDVQVRKVLDGVFENLDKLYQTIFNES